MDPSRALSELKLELPTTADAIKRAYLRGVKASPPERDPEGFQRVRAAYDFLREHPWCWEAEQVRDAEDTGVGLATSDAPVELLLASGDAVAPIQFGTLDDEAAEAAAGFGPQTDPSKPQKKPDPQILATWLIDQARDPTSEIPASALLFQAVDCALRLFQRKRGERGVELMRAVDERIEKDGVRPRELDDWITARSALVHELISLHRMMDPESLSVLARGIRRDDYRAASHEVGALLEIEGKALQRLLEKRAPSLLGAMAADAPPVRKARYWSGGRLIWLCIVMTYFLVKYCPTSGVSP